MIAGAVSEGIRLQMGQAAEHIDLIPHRRKRLQDRREFELRADGGGIPLILNHAVRNVDEAETGRSFGGPRGRQRRDHRIKERKRESRA
jgi:hypothetical protein